MNFAWPQLLWLLVAPAGWLAWELAHRRRAAASDHPHILRAEAGPHSLDLSPASAPVRTGRNRTHPRFWLALGLALAVVALARPQWGRIDEPVFDQSREILLALDLSRSMLTPDVQPSRLDRAKLLIQSLLDRLAGERVGLEIFSGTAFIQAPLSSDYEILREFLPSLGPDYMPQGGTDYAALIDAAAGAFSTGPGADRFLIILSDGGATDDNWRSHVKRLTERGIRVIALGIGTQAGGFIPDGSGGYMKDENGAVVMAKLENDTLRELAGRTVGVYRDASQWVDLAGLLKTTVEAGRKGKFVEKNTVRYVERFQWALAPALLCLLVSFWREFPVRPKPRDLRLPAKNGKGLQTAASLIVFLAALRLLPSASADAAGPPPLPPSALLGKIVGRLSAQDASTAPDWAELAQETVTWGEDLQTNHQSVAAGPVRDALDAVEAGAALDAKAADWPKLRSQLEALLKQSEEEKKKEQQQQKQQQQQQQQQQKSQQQNQQQQNQQKSSSQPQQSSGSPQQNQNQSQQPQNSPSSQRQNSGNPAQPPESNPQSQSAFGGIQQPAQPPPPSGGTQQVGGEPKQKDPDPAQSDPALAMSLQKLDQIHNQDSPAQLYQMIENNEPHPAPEKKGKNW